MNDVATTQARPNPITQFKHNLERLKEAGDFSVLPSNVSYDAFRNAAIVAVQDNPSILQCQPESVFKSIRRLAAAGLVPDGREAAIVPFKGAAQAIPMVFGLIKMVRRSGTVSDIRAHIVYQNEVDGGRFNYIVGDKEELTHEPILFGDRGPAVAAYAIASLTDGGIVREFMGADDIEKVRKSAASQRNGTGPQGIWRDWSEEMWKKTVIRRLCKRLDLSAEDMRRVAALDEDMAPPKDVTPQEEAPRMNLAQRIKAGAQDEAPREVQGEVMPPEDEKPGHWTDGYEPQTDGFPSDAFEQGAAGFKGGVLRRMVPFAQGTDEANDWLAGWDGAQKAGEESE